MRRLLVLDVPDGRIRTIHTVLSPHKLARLGPVADTWAVSHEVERTR